MATLSATLTLVSTDATEDQFNLVVTDDLTIESPSIGLSRATATTTGGDTIIVPDVDARRYFYIKNTGVDSTGAAIATDLMIEEADGNWFSMLAPGEFLWVPLNGNGTQLIQLEASGGTIVAEYAYWTKG